MSQLNLLDIAKANASDIAIGLIEESIKQIPEPTIIPAFTKEGLNYKTLVRTGVFSGSTWRNANEGATVGASTYENRLVEMFTLNPFWQCDRAVADLDKRGPQAVAAREGVGVVEQAFRDLARSFYYGQNATFGHTKGCPGLLDSVQSSMVVDAGGTTDNVASSVWGVKLGEQYVQWVLGNNGSFDLSPLKEETLRDANGNPYPGYTQYLLAYPGLHVGNIFSIVRIKKLTTDSGKGLTDLLLADACLKMEEQGLGRPDLFLMSPRSRTQLQKARTVVLQGGGAGRPTGAAQTIAPTPTEYEGIPIYATNAISNTETLAL